MTSEMSTSLREAVWARKASATTSADPSEPPKLFVLNLICMKEYAMGTGSKRDFARSGNYHACLMWCCKQFGLAKSKWHSCGKTKIKGCFFNNGVAPWRTYCEMSIAEKDFQEELSREGCF